MVTAPAPSAATKRSSSVVALAIHVTSWRSRSPRSAVTSPPAPRRATRLPSASRPYVTGPRFETTISRRRLEALDNGDRAAAGVVAGEAVEEHEPVPQQARREEVAADVLLPLQRARPSLAGVTEDLDAGLRAPVRRVDEPAGLAVRHLHDDPADATRDERPALPERLRHRQPEPLLDRLLDHNRRMDLERVDLDCADVVHVAEDEDVRVG